MTNDLISMAQAAREVGITRAGILYAVKKRILLAEKHGPYWLLDRKDVQHYRKNRPTLGRPRKNRAN